MAQLLADDNFPRLTVAELRRLGHDVLRPRDIDVAGSGTPDDLILEITTTDGRAVLTLDRQDYRRLHRQRATHAGMTCTFDPDFAALAARIHEAIEAAGVLHGKLIRVTRPGPGAR